MDLQEERQEVIKALLELDCFPSGMEFFPSTDDDQWTLIKRIIDDCDYYIIIIGGRYGSLSAEGISYTEKEYRYALETSKPIIAFLHKDPDSISKRKSEFDIEALKKLEAFKELIQKKMCKYWSGAIELGSVVSRSFVNLQKTHPAIGWVRGDLVPEKDSSTEILDLKREIEKLQKQIEDTKTKAPKGSEKLSQSDDEFTIQYTGESNDGSDYSFRPTIKSKGSITTNWNELFYQVSPVLINEVNESKLKNTLTNFIKEKAIQILTQNKNTKGHRFISFVINEDNYQTIKVQLRALGLITQSAKKRAISDKATYWTLTPYGDTKMNLLRAIRKDI